MSEERLILASSSPRRIELLSQLGVKFEVIPSTAEEVHDEQFTASELCLTNAWRKAKQVARQHPGALVLGADTLVTLEGRHFGKPRDAAQAEAMLAELSGRRHQVITGVALVRSGSGQRRTFAEQTHVQFRELSRGQIAEYMRLVPVLDKAGAYGIQDRGGLIISEIEGSLTNVIGLPVERLAGALCEWGLITPLERDRIVASQRSWSPES